MFFSGMIGIVVVYFFLSSHSPTTNFEKKLIITQVPSTVSPKATDELFYEGLADARIISFSEEKDEVNELTNEFEAAAFPSISYDYESVVFAARKYESDPWQIWTMSLNGTSKKQITFDSVNCIAPFYLPDGKIAFSKKWKNEIGEGYHLYSCDPDGKNTEKISYHPQSDFNGTVLSDGRIAFLSKEIIPEKLEETSLMVMRPDGTKAQKFYRGVPHHQVISRINENQRGELFFIERCPDGDAFIKTSYANPDQDRKELIHRENATLFSVSIRSGGTALLAQKTHSDNTISVYELDLENTGSAKLVYSDKSYHSISVISTELRERPKILPTSVSYEKSTGLILCQNINYEQTGLAAFIRVMGENQKIGEVEVEADGSFLLELPADQPFKIERLNSDKELLEVPSPWLWLRPNERRSFVSIPIPVGISPLNVEPLAIKKDPVRLPQMETMATLESVKGGSHEN